MSQLQNLARDLLAAGSATDEDNAIYQLFVDAKDSSLSCQQWKDDVLVKEEEIVDAVRPNSTAAYIINPTSELVICITPSSKLSAYTYDEDEREWVESEESPVAGYDVHPNGKLAAATDAKGQAYVFFQDPSQNLVCLDDGWDSTILPVSAVTGTPISLLVTQDELQVYYISDNDKFIHKAVRQSDGIWQDSAVIKYAFNEEIRAICIGDNESFALTGGDDLLKVGAEGEKLQLGTVKDGKFIPKTTEECFMRIVVPIHIHIGGCGWRRRRWC